MTDRMRGLEGVGDEVAGLVARLARWRGSFDYDLMLHEAEMVAEAEEMLARLARQRDSAREAISGLILEIELLDRDLGEIQDGTRRFPTARLNPETVESARAALGDG